MNNNTKNMNKKYISILLLNVAFLFWLPDSLLAQQITAKAKSGRTGSIEILRIEGDSLLYKMEGEEFLLQLSLFDEETLIRIIKELGKRKKTTTPSKTNPLSGNSSIENNLLGQEVGLKELMNLPEQYWGKKVKMTNLRFISTKKLHRNMGGKEKYIGFWAEDTDFKASFFIFPKRDAAIVLGLKSNQRINISGEFAQVQYYIRRDKPEEKPIYLSKLDHFFVEKIEIVK